ncbi:MAG: ABC transporter substrate-binding protein [Myxococcales bacterium]|nr:ABC transporter substrate-binding protein [Myxococcales bacterium]
MLSTQRGLLWAAALGVATIAGACTSVLDFTECYADEDCRSFFTDNKPMRCDTDGRCAVKDEGCDQNSECEALGDSYICGLSHRCYDYSEGGDLCDEPVFPNADERDNVVFVGSLINRAGDGAAIEQGIRLAIEEFNDHAELAAEGHAKIAWFACDTKGSKDRARQIAEFLAGSSDSTAAVGVSALIGPFGNEEFVEVVEEVSLAGNINAFTISPTSLVESFGPQDPGRVIWRGGPGATRYANALLARLNDEAPERMLTILSTASQPWTLFTAMAVKKDVNGQERWWINIDDVGGEMGAQGITSYNNVDEIPNAVAAAVAADLGGEAQVLLLLGGPETGSVLEEYYAMAGSLPARVIAPHWALSGLNESLASIGDAQALAAIEIITPDMPNAGTTAFAQRFQERFSAAPVGDAYQAYDATLLTLFSMAGVTDGSIVGPKISSVTRGLLNGDSPIISAADPGNTFDAGASALANGNDVTIDGAAYSIQIDAARREVCTDFLALRASGTPSEPGLEPAARYQVNCPVEVSGTW